MTDNLNIEYIINNNIDVRKMGLKLIEREYSTSLGRIDILTEDEYGNYIPIEIKVGTASDSAIGQILRYMYITNAKRGIIMANNFTAGVICIAKDLNIDLITYTLDVIINDKSMCYDDLSKPMVCVNIDKSENILNKIVDEIIGEYLIYELIINKNNNTKFINMSELLNIINIEYPNSYSNAATLGKSIIKIEEDLNNYGIIKIKKSPTSYLFRFEFKVENATGRRF